MESYTIEVSEPVYKLLHQQIDTRHDSIDDFLEHLLLIAPFVLPKERNGSDKASLQSDIIKLYSTELEYQELLGLKQLLAEFFARKAVAEADMLWDEKNLSEQVMESWLNEA